MANELRRLSLLSCPAFRKCLHTRTQKLTRKDSLQHQQTCVFLQFLYLADIYREGEGLPNESGGRPPARQQSGGRGLPTIGGCPLPGSRGAPC